MVGNHNDVEKKLWDVADQLRANSRLKSSEYSVPVLGLIFLRYADHKFSAAQRTLEGAGGGRRKISRVDYQAKGVLYVPEPARFTYLLNLPEGHDIGRALNDAMKAIEADNEELKGVLPRDYSRIDKDTLVALLKTFASISMDLEGDVFGKIYEYFLGKFAMAEGQRGGEFFTPTSLVKLIVEVIEPYHGRILDPACGSAGMFVQSANFVTRHKKRPSDEISLYGQEKVAETIQLSRMSLAVHGLSGHGIKQGNSYYEDVHKSIGKFDFVMANPPFNVDGVDKEKIKNDKRYALGIPTVDNANYLWIQMFWSALNEKGRAGFVMGNSAADARGSELEIRKKLIDASAVDVMISIGPNFFYTVTLPCTLWFLDKGKSKTDRKDKVLFIDAQRIFKQIDRAHREFSSDQIEFIANIVRLYRGEKAEEADGSANLMKQHFPRGKYRDVAGLCKTLSFKDLREHGFSLNPGRYVGVVQEKDDGSAFAVRLQEVNEALEILHTQAHKLEKQISRHMSQMMKEVN